MKVRLAQNLGRCPHWWSGCRNRPGLEGMQWWREGQRPSNSRKEGTSCPKSPKGVIFTMTLHSLPPQVWVVVEMNRDIPPVWFSWFPYCVNWKIHPWWTVVRNDAEIFPQWFELQLHTMVNISQEGFLLPLYGHTFTSPKLLGCRVYFMKRDPPPGWGHI